MCAQPAVPREGTRDSTLIERAAPNSARVATGWLITGIVVLILPIVCAGILLSAYRFSFSGIPSSAHEHWGQFGDLFGGTLNPLLAWLSLLTTIVSLRYAVQAIEVSSKAIEQSTAQFTEQRLLEADKSRKHQAMEMHKLWISPEMQRIRTELWVFLKEQEIYEKTGEPIYIGFFRFHSEAKTRNVYYSLGTVTHFINDLNSTLSQGLIDRETLTALLGPSIAQWIKVYDRLDFRRGETDGSPESWQEHDWHKHVAKSFYENYLVGRGF